MSVEESQFFVEGIKIQERGPSQKVKGKKIAGKNQLL